MVILMEIKVVDEETLSELEIQAEIKVFLEKRDWLVLPTHGNAFQSGFPDFYITHPKFKARWLEIKKLPNYRFTKAQLDVFPKISNHGAGIWIMNDSTKNEYLKLFNPPNWHHYLKRLY
jgi:hypothetical protein